MITQEYKQGNDVIKIETAESLNDAKKNNFRDDIYVRCYVNGKLTDNYMAMIRFIVDNANKNNVSLIPTGENLEKLRKEMLTRQKEAMLKPLQDMKEQIEIPKEIKNKLNEFLHKVDNNGVRNKK